MKTLKYYIYFIVLLSCGNVTKDNVDNSKVEIEINKKVNNVNTDDTVVIGLALDAKAGAMVISSSDNKNYYLDSINSWDMKFYEKVVKVSGKLSIEEFKVPDLDSGEQTPQFFLGTKRTILHPKWELVDTIKVKQEDFTNTSNPRVKI